MKPLERPVPAAAEDSLLVDPFANEGESSFDLERYLRALRRRWPLIAVTILLSLGIGLVRFSLTPKEYRATTEIQIERKRLSVLALGQASYLEDWWNMEYYPTQYRLLRSRGMAERVVQDLRLYEDPIFLGPGASLPSEVSQVSLAEDEAMLARIASRLQGAVDIRPIAGTQNVEITFRSHAPQLAAKIANGYADAFIRWGITERNETVGRAEGYLEEQIDELQTGIAKDRQELAAFSEASGLSLDPEGKALIERQNTLREQYNRVSNQRISKDAAYRALLAMSDDAVAAQDARPEATNLRAEILDLESDYNARLTTYKPDHPDMKGLQKRIEDKKTQLQSQVRERAGQLRAQARGELQQVQQERSDLQQAIARIDQEINSRNSDALEYQSIRNAMEDKQKMLDELQERLSETKVTFRRQADNQDSNIRVVDRAFPPGAPFRPRLKRELTLAVGAGLILGIGLLILLELLDRTVKTPDELENLTGLPTLAVIPDLHDTGRKRYRYYQSSYGYGDELSQAHQPGGQPDPEVPKDEHIELLPFRKPRLAICEAYRSLRTALLLSSAEELRLVTLTSAEPGEGKTATCCNLAVVMAQLDRRVLIIDGDLRRPRIHKIFGKSNRVGLVSYLTGSATGEHLYQDVGIPNLYICPSGPIPPNPSELLASKRMRAFLDTARTHFDFVILDSPPILPVADAAILGTVSDGVILCARSAALDREAAKASVEQLSYGKVRMLGTVLNRYRAGHGRYDKRYQYYGSPEPQVAKTVDSAA